MSRWGARLLLPLLACCAVCPAAPRLVDGPVGAIQIPFRMPADGQATIALCTPQGRLERIIAQCAELPKGEHAMRWDGMDLWGNLVPAGTQLVVKVLTGPGVKAIYEFTVGKRTVCFNGERIVFGD